MATKKPAIKKPEVEEVVSAEDAPATAVVEVEEKGLVPVFVKSKGHGFPKKINALGELAAFATVTINGVAAEVECDVQVEVPAEIAEVLKSSNLDG